MDKLRLVRLTNKARVNILDRSYLHVLPSLRSALAAFLIYLLNINVGVRKFGLGLELIARWKQRVLQVTPPPFLTATHCMGTVGVVAKHACP